MDKGLSLWLSKVGISCWKKGLDISFGMCLIEIPPENPGSSVGGGEQYSIRSQYSKYSKYSKHSKPLMS
jgi:hypothetical protein